MTVHDLLYCAHVVGVGLALFAAFAAAVLLAVWIWGRK